MLRLPETAPRIYQAFLQGQFVVKRTPWKFKAVAADQSLEQTIKGDSNPNNKYVLSERALWTMNFDTKFIKIVWKMGKLWHLKNSIWPAFSGHFEYLITFQNFFNCLF